MSDATKQKYSTVRGVIYSKTINKKEMQTKDKTSVLKILELNENISSSTKKSH